jgi:hypothetical protein
MPQTTLLALHKDAVCYGFWWGLNDDGGG